jgi:type IV fimbrial biogenesis protein FimT
MNIVTTQKFRKSYCTGVSLLEILIAMAILGIIISVAMPGFSEFGANQRLIGLAEQVHGHLQQARSEAIARSTTVYANFAVDGTASWEYGVSSENSLCDLTVTAPTDADACVITVDDGDGIDNAADFVLMRFTSADYDDVAMNIASFSSATTQFVFDPVRGAASSGQVNLEGSTGRLLRVAVSLLGRVSICSPDGSVQNYETC